MKIKLRKVLVVFQILAFVPFFFGTFLFIVQSFTNFFVIPYAQDYKPGLFIVTNKAWVDAGRTAGGSEFVDGTIGSDTVRLSLKSIIDYKQKAEIGDTVYVWYKDDKKTTLVRHKNDMKFKVSNYIYDMFPNLMLFGIPPFIIITYILRRMKKKSLNNTI